MSEKRDPERVVREIKRKTRRKFSAEEKIRIVLEGLRGEESIAGLCRRECAGGSYRRTCLHSGEIDGDRRRADHYIGGRFDLY